MNKNTIFHLSNYYYVLSHLDCNDTYYVGTHVNNCSYNLINKFCCLEIFLAIYSCILNRDENTLNISYFLFFEFIFLKRNNESQQAKERISRTVFLSIFLYFLLFWFVFNLTKNFYWFLSPSFFLYFVCFVIFLQNVIHSFTIFTKTMLLLL